MKLLGELHVFIQESPSRRSFSTAVTTTMMTSITIVLTERPVYSVSS